MDRIYEAKATRVVTISFEDSGMTEAECLQLAVDILENGDGVESDDCVYSGLKRYE